MNPTTDLAWQVFEQIIADAWCVIDKYCSDNITFAEGRGRIQMLDHILIRLGYEGQDEGVLLMIEDYRQTLLTIENKLVMIDLRKRKLLHELGKEAVC